jgi:hypothetical protein
VLAEAYRTVKAEAGYLESALALGWARWRQVGGCWLLLDEEGMPGPA